MKSQNLITILGDGGWGTTLALLLHMKGNRVRLWSAFADYASLLAKTRENKKFLPGIKLPEQIEITADLDAAIEGSGAVVLAVPSQYMRLVLKAMHPKKLDARVVISVSKGIECQTLMRVSEVIYDCLGKIDLAVLSGPTISYEVARGFPTAAVVASQAGNIASVAQEIFMTQRFRVYTNDDLVGVEVGGAVKNVIAIAAGISDGLGFGNNAKATLMDRGLVEMARLGMAMGARRDTFWGLSGAGDLMTTCASPKSRNHWFGEEVGKGKKAKDILSSTEMVVEGVATTKSICQLAKKFNVEMPITNEVFAIIYEDKKPSDALSDLMSRKAKPEVAEEVF